MFGRYKSSKETISFNDFIDKYEEKKFNVENYVAQRVSRDQVAYIANSSGTTGLSIRFVILCSSNKTNSLSFSQQVYQKVF